MMEALFALGLTLGAFLAGAAASEGDMASFWLYAPIAGAFACGVLLT